eukprot:199645-Chlamydomonas_euryale.AAC.1
MQPCQPHLQHAALPNHTSSMQPCQPHNPALCMLPAEPGLTLAWLPPSCLAGCRCIDLRRGCLGEHQNNRLNHPSAAPSAPPGSAAIDAAHAVPVHAVWSQAQHCKIYLLQYARRLRNSHPRAVHGGCCGAA